MSTDSRLEKALDILRKHDRDVEMPMVSSEGGTVVPVDGIPRTPEEIYEMADRLQPDRT